MKKSEIMITGQVDGKRQCVKYEPSDPIPLEQAEMLRQLIVAGTECVFNLPDTTMTVCIGLPGSEKQSFEVAQKHRIKVTVESFIVTP